MGKRAASASSIPRNRSEPGAKQGAPLPGVLLIHHNREPLCVPLPLVAGQLDLGRGRGALEAYVDPRMSRRHARVRYDGRCFLVEDLGSHNGTFLDGIRLESGRAYSGARVLRTGDSLFILCADLRSFQSAGILREEGIIKGPALQAAYEQARGAARLGDMLHITGESGAGKEGVARMAHACGAHSTGPFIAVNCATIAEGVAERLLFGARRGAYSGAVTDAEGFVQAASGGTLFLDEIAELPLPVQAKLLRVVESHEVLPLGANKAVPVQMHLYSATHKNLRTEVHQGRFREDLYFRISRPRITLPPLRQRPEEMPWLIQLALEKLAPQLTAEATMIELCLLRFWPGNVRELMAEVRTAGLTALAAGRSTIEPTDLCEDAGRRFGSTPPALAAAGAPALVATPGSPPGGTGPLPVPIPAPSGAEVLRPASPPPTLEVIEAALRKEKGNISRTARALGLHRTQLKRFMLRFGLTTAPAEGTTEE